MKRFSQSYEGNSLTTQSQRAKQLRSKSSARSEETLPAAEATQCATRLNHPP